MNKKQKSNRKSCNVCGKKSTMGNNKPHSQHTTKRIILPNIQKSNGELMCTRCLKTKNKE